jgi:hypothetical protein
MSDQILIDDQRFQHKKFPCDLGDENSRLLASQISGSWGAMGVISEDDEEFNASLPENWICYNISAVCKIVGGEVPLDLARKIFLEADANQDRKWNIDEFMFAVHQLVHENKKQKGVILDFFDLSYDL